MYDLVKDINSYKLFLPSCKNSYIISSDNCQPNEVVVAKIEVEKLLMKTHFVSKNIYTPYQKIDSQLVSGPFSHLCGYWQFKQKQLQCQIDFYLEYEFNNFIVANLYSSIFRGIISQQILEAFLLRADQIYKS